MTRRPHNGRMRGYQSLPGSIAIGLALLATAFVWWAILTWRLEAHEAPAGWAYPLSCCSNFDCRRVANGAVSERPEGYVIPGTGEIVGYQDKRIRQSPDGEFHWCAHQSGIDAGRTICLFVPPRSF